MNDTVAMDVHLSIKALARRPNISTLLMLRWLGAWIDFIILASFLLVPESLLGNELYQRTIWIWIAPLILYFPILEGIWGRSVGKLLTGLIVVDKAGHAPGFWKAILRTIPRIIEVNPLLIGGIPAAIAVVASKERQRLGDMLAQTYVVKRKDLKTINSAGPSRFTA